MRAIIDTSIGGQGREFPSTVWSRILGSSGEDYLSRRSSMESLARAYWKPVYLYIRSRWAKSNEDSKDLTQGFFVWMLESDFCRRADPLRGRFRAFLKVALEHYLGGEERKRRSLKRGGEVFLLTLEDLSEDVCDGNPTEGPEETMDRAWKAEILSRATDLLQESYRQEDKDVYFHVFRDYYHAVSEELDHRGVAAKHRISVTDVGNYLKDAKRRFREIVTLLVAETVGGREDLREEMRLLFGEGP